ncbi:MAG: insulinase family protein [Deltaproteobacteria bacterium]|nr:insulinase family protein [Deltaproteobacteria bacterium]
MKVWNKMYQKSELKNGIRIVTERLDHYRSVSLGIWVGAGSRDEDAGTNGISHFIEHMIFKGTRNRNTLQIAKELDAIGGLSNAFTSKEYTCFHSKVLDKHFPVLADIMSDIFLNSVFDPDHIDKERQVILQEISMVEDSPEEQIYEIFNNLYWSDHPLGMSILGTGETVSAIDKEGLLDHKKRFYFPSRIIISVAGNIDHESVVEFFRPIFEPLEPGEPAPPLTVPRINQAILCQYKPLEQVHLCMGGKAPHLLNDMRFAGTILNTILGGNMSSRLFQEIREKRGLAYSIYSFISAYIDTGILGICAGTDPREANNVLDLIKKEIKKIKDGDISETDLKEAKEHLIGGILLGSESTDSRMLRLAKNEYLFNRYISYDEVVESLESVTVEDVVACAREAFDPINTSLATLGPFKEEDLTL